MLVIQWWAQERIPPFPVFAGTVLLIPRHKTAAEVAQRENPAFSRLRWCSYTNTTTHNSSQDVYRENCVFSRLR